MKNFIAFHPVAFVVFVDLCSGVIVLNPIPRKERKKRNLSPKLCMYIFICALCGFLIANFLVNSPVIAAPFGILTSVSPLILSRRQAEKLRHAMQALWPEILDHIISGLQSGLSLAQTLASLGKRGPERTKPIFLQFHNDLIAGVDFETALLKIKVLFSDPLADQVCEVLRFAKGSGSRDTALTLRTLADFMRSDLAVRSEISAKHGWIKNSAGLAAVAPWLLLIILATQPSTVAAYSSSAGITILFIGVLLTGIAYAWMAKVGKLPNSPRVFSQ